MSKIVWLWSDGVQWKISIMRWWAGIEIDPKLTTYSNLSFERAEQVRAIMYKLYKDGICDVPNVALKYNHTMVLSVFIKGVSHE